MALAVAWVGGQQKVRLLTAKREASPGARKTTARKEDLSTFLSRQSFRAKSYADLLQNVISRNGQHTRGRELAVCLNQLVVFIHSGNRPAEKRPPLSPSLSRLESLLVHE